MIQLVQAARRILLGSILMTLGLAPGRLQFLADAIHGVVGRIGPRFYPVSRAEVQTEPSMWLIRFGAAYALAAVLACFIS